MHHVLELAIRPECSSRRVKIAKLLPCYLSHSLTNNRTVFHARHSGDSLLSARKCQSKSNHCIQYEIIKYTVQTSV